MYLLFQARLLGAMEAVTGDAGGSELAFAGVAAAVAGPATGDTGQHDVGAGRGLPGVHMTVGAGLGVVLLMTRAKYSGRACCSAMTVERPA